MVQFGVEALNPVCGCGEVKSLAPPRPGIASPEKVGDRSSKYSISQKAHLT